MNPSSDEQTFTFDIRYGLFLRQIHQCKHTRRIALRMVFSRMWQPGELLIRRKLENGRTRVAELR